MHPLLKVLLIGCSLFIILVVIGLAGFTFYWKRQGPEIMAGGQKSLAEGKEAGLSNSESQCVADAVARYSTDPGIRAAIARSLWLDGCLESSSAEADFCTGVPEESSLIATAQWRSTRCAGFGLQQDPGCRNVVGRIQNYCESDLRRAKIAKMR